MFNKNTTKNSTIESTSINLIGSGTQLIGDIKSNGDFRIDGSLKGTISVKGKLVVGATGTIEGEIDCQNADVSGEIKGCINVSELLSLKSTARLNCDIITSKISIEPEALFTGNCSMGGVVKNIQANNDVRPEAKAKQPTNNYLKYSGMAFQMGAIITLGVFGGSKLDEWLNLKTPLFTLVLSLLAVALAIYISIKDFLKK